MKNRVYGIIGISAVRSNWNADFTGRPRTSAKGDIIATDKPLKYAMRKYWNNEDDNAFYFKTMNENMNPRTMKERYESLFEPLADANSQQDVMRNLFSCIDVMNFGATFAESKYSFSITGAVQIQQGFNLYDSAEIEVLDILSPFRNPNNKKDGTEKTQNTKGEQVVADECHYVYPFSVDPNNYSEFLNLDNFNGYTEKAYLKFKDAARIAVTALTSCTKAGCNNELAIFVELKEDSKAYIPTLADYVRFEKGADKNTYDVTSMNFLSDMADEIESIEIYYNDRTVNVECDFASLNSKVKKCNIFTGKSLED